MSDFAAQGIDLVHEEPKQDAFYRAWSRKIDLFGRVSHFLSSAFKTGNPVVLRHMAKIDKSTIRTMRAASDMFNGLDPAKPLVIPVDYTFINPATVTKVGGSMFGQRYKIKISDEDRAVFKNPKTQREKEIVKQIPKEQLEQIKKSGEVVLGPDLIFVAHYKKDDWETWADPLLMPIFDDIRFKQLLRRMDESVARNIMNSIVVFKLGNAKDGLAATAGEMKKFANLLKTPTKSKTLVWNDLVSIETSYPPTNLMLNDEKYKAVNTDILSGIGISEVLINGVGGNYANSFLSVKTLLEKLETGRSLVINWLYTELELIRTAMGWDHLPKIRFGRMTLRDERAEKALVLNLFEFGIISRQTLLSYFEEDWAVEIQRIKEEEKQMKLLKRPRSSQPGRPVNTDGIPQDKERDTKPQGMGTEDLSGVIDIVTKLVCENKGLEDINTLSPEDRYNIECLSKALYPKLSCGGLVNKEEVSRIISEVLNG
jgi:hypothetical protein